MVDNKFLRVKASEDEQTTATENGDSNVFKAGASRNSKEFGFSGTEIFGGIFSEEYLQKLQGMPGAKEYDRIRRSESQVAMLMAAIKNPIKSANWDIQSVDSADATENQIVEFLKAVLFEQLDFDAFKHEALTFLEFGHVVFEVVHNAIINHPKFGTKTGLAGIKFRSQKTISEWNLDKATGGLASVDQQITSDVGKDANIPAEFLLVITNQKEGDNYEGISTLRPIYGAWIRKNLYLKLIAIGLEKYAIGTPVGTTPATKGFGTPEFTQFQDMLRAYTSNEFSFMIVPEGYKVELEFGNFDAEKVKSIILMENNEMVNAFVANFLALGMNGSGGAFSLGTDLSDFFLSGIKQYADLICGAMNRKLIPDLVKLNYGERAQYPKMKVTGINDKAGKEFAEIVTSLVEKNVIKADEPLDDFVRKQYGLPKADPTTARSQVSTSVNAYPSKQFSETRIQLADTYKKDFNKSQEKIKALMQDQLTLIYGGLKSQASKLWKSSSEADKVKIPAQLEANPSKYRAALKDALAELASNAYEDAKKLTPAIKLSERLLLAAPRGGFFDALPKPIKNLVNTQAQLIADTQAMNIEKAVAFQFGSSSTGTDSLDQILFDLDEKVLPVIDGSTSSGISLEAAATNAVSTIQNQAQMNWFFEPEVFNEIESFTFMNEDPVSEICSALAGTTFAANDPAVDTYGPPLHHNCKSRLSPNMRSDKDNPPINGQDTVKGLSVKAQNAMTLHECGDCDYKIFKI